MPTTQQGPGMITALRYNDLNKLRQLLRLSLEEMTQDDELSQGRFVELCAVWFGVWLCLFNSVYDRVSYIMFYATIPNGEGAELDVDICFVSERRSLHVILDVHSDSPTGMSWLFASGRCIWFESTVRPSNICRLGSGPMCLRANYGRRKKPSDVQDTRWDLYLLLERARE